MKTILLISHSSAASGGGEDDFLRLLIYLHGKYIPLIEKNYETIKNNHQWKDRIFEMKNLLKNIQRER